MCGKNVRTLEYAQKYARREDCQKMKKYYVMCE